MTTHHSSSPLHDALRRIIVGRRELRAPRHSDPGCLCYQCSASYDELREMARDALALLPIRPVPRQTLIRSALISEIHLMLADLDHPPLIDRIFPSGWTSAPDHKLADLYDLCVRSYPAAGTSIPPALIPRPLDSISRDPIPPK